MISNSKSSTRATIASRRTSEPRPPSVTVQVYELLRETGFSINEALDAAAKTRKAYLSTTQRVFEFEGATTIEIVACTAKLKYAPRGFETPNRSIEKIEASENLDLNIRAQQIRERREKDERRGNR